MSSNNAQTFPRTSTVVDPQLSPTKRNSVNTLPPSTTRPPHSPLIPPRSVESLVHVPPRSMESLVSGNESSRHYIIWASTFQNPYKILMYLSSGY